MKLFKESPNDGKPGELHDIAKDQLALYEKVAPVWPLVSENGYYRCGQCHQAIWRESDDEGHGYLWQPEEIQALIVAHVRQRHSEAVNATD